MADTYTTENKKAFCIILCWVLHGSD